MAGESNSTKESKRQGATNPLNNHIQIRAADGKVTVTARDYEAFVELELKGPDGAIEIVQEGTVLLPADDLMGFIRNTREGYHISITTDAGSSKAHLEWFSYVKHVTVLRDKEMEPRKAVESTPVVFKLNQKMIDAALRCNRQINPDIRPDNRWPGVLFDFSQKGAFWLAAFNSSMIYVNRTPLEHDHGVRFVVGGRMIPLIAEFGKSGDVTVVYDEQQAAIHISNGIGRAVITTVENKYKENHYVSIGVDGLETGQHVARPAQDAVKPRYKITLDKSDFEIALRQTAEVLNREDHAVAFTVEGAAGEGNAWVIGLYARHRFNANEANTKVTADIDPPPPSVIKIGLHYGNVLQALKDIPGSKIDLYVYNESIPILIASPDEPEFLATSITLLLSFEKDG